MFSFGSYDGYEIWSCSFVLCRLFGVKETIRPSILLSSLRITLSLCSYLARLLLYKDASIRISLSLFDRPRVLAHSDHLFYFFFF
jgi:hypothetical protein